VHTVFLRVYNDSRKNERRQFLTLGTAAFQDMAWYPHITHEAGRVSQYYAYKKGTVLEVALNILGRDRIMFAADIYFLCKQKHPD